MLSGTRWHGGEHYTNTKLNNSILSQRHLLSIDDNLLWMMQYKIIDKILSKRATLY